MAEIDWAKVGSGDQFEKIVGVLISTLHPGSERIDGSGGDGGRDHQLRTADRLDIWQSKYFRRRLSTGNRKRQIVDSLQTAAALQPDSWTLVTPMEASPGELKWFDDLSVGYPFPLVWRRESWLNARLAEHPGIARHFMGAADEYVALLRELDQEKDALVDGLPSGRDRIESLATRINDANPFYAVDLSIRGGRITSAAIVPKYRGAEKDSPITVSFNVSFGDQDEKLLEQMQNAFDWGEQVHIPSANVSNVVVTAPHGLGPSGESGDIIIGPAEVTDPKLSATALIRDPTGKVVASLPITFSRRVGAARGVTTEGSDRTGAVRMRLRIDMQDLRLSLQLTGFDEHKALLPGELLPALRFWHHAVAPNQISVRMAGMDETAPWPLPGSENVPAGYIVIIENLERVQAATGHSFGIPQQITADDRQQLGRAVDLLDGKRVRLGKLVEEFTIHSAGQPLTVTQDPQHLAMTPEDSFVASICGETIDLGRGTYYFGPVTLRAGEGSEASTFYVTPVSGRTSAVEVSLGTPPEVAQST